MNSRKNFNEEIVSRLDTFLEEQSKRFPADETITIDLHCHDHNSNVPDELLGRILGFPRPGFPPRTSSTVLKSHGCDTFTVTNHNNARSCYELLEKGIDVLMGAEFSCMVPDYRIGIHVWPTGSPRTRKRSSTIQGRHLPIPGIHPLRTNPDHLGPPPLPLSSRRAAAHGIFR